MINGSKLIGRSVVDMDAAEKLGKANEIIVQQDGERVAGFILADAGNILGSGGTRRSIPASALNAILAGCDYQLEALPRRRSRVARNAFSESRD